MSSLGCYAGQTRKARELALKELGCERVARMSDSDINKWIESSYAIFWGDCEDGDGVHRYDAETIALIPGDVYQSILDSIVWLER